MSPFTSNVVILFCSIFILGNAEWVAPPGPCLCQEFRCDNGTACLHKSRVCNGYRDCPDGEDERHFDPALAHSKKCSISDAKKHKCGEGEFRCKFGGCIGLGAVCDGRVDCVGGVDEATDFCHWVHGNHTGPPPQL